MVHNLHQMISTLHEEEWSETYQIFPLSFIIQWVSRTFYRNIQTGYESRTIGESDGATQFEP